ncbi:MAG: DEAD/DEAH box helicase [Candidatus Nanopelagicales bacterium]
MRQDRQVRQARQVRQVRQARPERPERRPRPAPVPALTGPNAFVDLGVPASLAAVLATQSITEPTPIQALTIPATLAGRDVLGRGRTGSGKTLAFGLPMLTRLMGRRGRLREPRGLVLAPTRELAMQVGDVLKPLAAAVGMRVQLVMGGASYDRQIRGLERADIVVATPGRLVDLADRGAVDLGSVEVFVLDEADHMADLGFVPEIEAIMGRMPDATQGLLFSATLDHDVDRLVRTHLKDPVEHSADPVTATVGTMEHHVVVVHPKDKDAVTADIAARRGRTLAFVRTKLGADRLAGQLEEQGVRTAALHGGMKQGARTRTLDDFRRGRIDVLVATDVAARGLHVDDVDLVLHVDLPDGPKEYLHRSGRTARAGASGTVISLATIRQQRVVAAITSKAGVDAEVRRVRPGDEGLRALIS